MNPFLNQIILNGFLLLFIQHLFKNIIINGFVPLLLGAFILGVINAYVRPFFIILSLPINILTLGLFTFIINAFMLRLTAVLVPGFSISTFGAAFFGALIMSIINGIFFQRVKIRYEKK